MTSNNIYPPHKRFTILFNKNETERNTKKVD